MSGIQSIGLPPERHADRIVAEMMRELAKKRSTLWHAMEEIMRTSSDGTPRAQRKMEQRVKLAGATRTELVPGKRGKYTLAVWDITGWDQSRDAEIQIGDPIPERPWIACNVTRLESKGGGRNDYDLRSSVWLFITHHCMSRTAQRLGMRSAGHMGVATRLIWNAAMKLIGEKGLDGVLAAPPQGWRVQLIEDVAAVVVLQKHFKKNALVAATVIG
jgi:hypothetical protein